MNKKIYDCIVIGAGPAGLLASIYLARFRRNILLFDGGLSRASLIPTSHNYPGMKTGIPGKQILEKLRNQIAHYPVKIIKKPIVKTDKNRFIFTVETAKKSYQARTVLLATGTADIEPSLPNLKNVIRNGYVRHCAICDGYEVIDKKIAIIGNKDTLIKEFIFLYQYTSNIMLFCLEEKIHLTAQDKKTLNRYNVKFINEPISEIILKKNKISGIRISGSVYEFEAIYSVLGSIPHSDLAVQMHATLDENNAIVTDVHQKTSIKGLYAAGDVTKGLNQIVTAFGDAARAACDIHNYLSDLESLKK